MKFTKLTKLAGASVLAASLSLGAAVAPAQAQVLEDEGIYETEGVYEEGYDNDGFDWGWLGLLGLIGLAGLAGGKKRRNETVYSEPVEPGVGTTNYRR